ncbi:MAG: excinuclease ABC subunit UvrC [Deltaproteobacteria bacterium]|nr:excinuclease ABC subunit UvrC [Deltaproteobacteria bacterium]
MSSEPDAGAASPGKDLEDKLEALVARPGVYLLKDRHGKVIYVGKARSLRTRVRTYFRGGDERMQVVFLMQRVADFESLVTASEKEALILENNLIKQYKPRYNIRLKDDKSYVSVKVTVQDAWPRVIVTRKIAKDGSRYFGPFHSAVSVRETIDTLRKVIPLRTCSDTVFRNRSRPCLEYQIKRCLAPCCLPVDRDAYEAHLREAMLLLGGKRVELIDHLRRAMGEAAAAERFEQAATLRDRLRAIEKTQERQQAVAHGGNDQDIFGFYREGGFIEAQVLFVRQGKLTSTQAYQLEDIELPDEELVRELVTQFYQGERYVPDEVVLPIEIEDQAVRAEYLSERKGRRVEIHRPQRGDRVRLLEMARANAEQGFRERRDGDRQYEKISDELRRKLHLRNAPKRIECVDISTFQGGMAVGSLVSFDDGQPDKNNYRRYRIKSVVGQDDFAMMFEVLRRRFERAKRDNEFPDLLVVDGGKGQLNVALAVLQELGIDQVDAVGLAKERVVRAARESAIERSDERVFLPGRVNPVVLRRNANALFLLQRLRDEAHRFAITYHRALRGKERLRSVLDAIPGVGAERRRRLLRAFGSVKRMRAATVDELAAVPGISPVLAHTVRAALDRLAATKDVDTRRGRLVAVPVEADEVDEEPQTRAGDAADDAEGEAGRDVDSPDPGDYA